HPSPLHDLQDPLVAFVEPVTPQVFASHVGSVPVTNHRREVRQLLRREPEHLAHLTQRALTAIGGHLRHHRCAVASVPLVNLLDHLFTSLVLEIDVDVRWFVALCAQEALEQQITASWIYRGDPQDVTYGAVGGAAAPLAQDLSLPRNLD